MKEILDEPEIRELLDEVKKMQEHVYYLRKHPELNDFPVVQEFEGYYLKQAHLLINKICEKVKNGED